MSDTPNFTGSDGTRIWITPTLPAAQTTGDDAGKITEESFSGVTAIETSLMELEWHNGFTTLDTTRPENRQPFLDKGSVLVPGIETHSSFPLTITKQKEGDSGAYAALLKAYDDQVPLTMKVIYPDLTGRWGTFNLTGARELAPVGGNLTMEAGIAVATVVRISGTAVIPPAPTS